MDRKAGDSDVNDGSQSASDSELPRSALQITARSSPNNLSAANTDRTSSARSSDIGEPQSQESKTSVPLCEVCRSMFSTLDGLKALVSKNGYEYVPFEEIDDIKRNCSLCRLFVTGKVR